MRNKTKATISVAFRVCLYLFFIFMFLNVKIFWVSLACFTPFVLGLAGDLYLTYRYKYSKDREKRRIISQRPFYHFYYDKWYRPADSKELEHEAAKIVGKKKGYR